MVLPLTAATKTPAPARAPYFVLTAPAKTVRGPSGRVYEVYFRKDATVFTSGRPGHIVQFRVFKTDTLVSKDNRPERSLRPDMFGAEYAELHNELVALLASAR